MSSGTRGLQSDSAFHDDSELLAAVVSGRKQKFCRSSKGAAIDVLRFKSQCFTCALIAEIAAAAVSIFGQQSSRADLQPNEAAPVEIVTASFPRPFRMAILS
jgi:hypothetical protein